MVACLAMAGCVGFGVEPTATAVPRTPVAKASGKVVTDIQQGVTTTPNTATPLPPPPTTTPQPFARLELNSFRAYTDSIGSVWVVAIATNTGEAMAVDTAATLYLLGPDGKTMATTYATLILDELEPGESTPIRGVFANPPKGWASVRVEPRAVSPVVLRPMAFVRGLKSLDVKVDPGDGKAGATLGGRIQNTGKSAAVSVKAISVALDPAGKVVEIADGYASQSEIKPGATAAFSTQFVATQNVDKYQVFLQGRLPPR